MIDTKSDNNEPVAQHNSRANLERLLDEIIQQPERRAEIAQNIDTVFGQDKVVLVLDMSGFSRTTQRHGIVAFLLMIHEMRLIAKPSLQTHGGLLVKAEADNLFCLFDTVDAAVGASREIRDRLNVANMLLPEDHRLYVSVGIGYGRILNIGDEDLFGDEVNLASKLGEDMAQQGEILLTANARAALQDATIQTREETVSISGLSLAYHVVQS